MFQCLSTIYHRAAQLVLRILNLSVVAIALAFIHPYGAFAQPATAPAAAQIAPIPADLPLEASPPLNEEWLHDANILQPYGHSAFVALTDIKDRPERLKREFGFNAIIVQPPDSHNTIA